jgi:hypothetical protein
VEGTSRKSGTETERAHIDQGLGKLQYNTLARLSSLILRLEPIGNKDLWRGYWSAQGGSQIGTSASLLRGKPGCFSQPSANFADSQTRSTRGNSKKRLGWKEDSGVGSSRQAGEGGQGTSITY